MTTRTRRDPRRYRHEVESLLDEIRGHTRELRRLQAVGARGPGLAGRKHELARARGQLAAVVRDRAA